MNGIGWAVKQLQEGRAVCRSGWNGKGMYLAFLPQQVLRLSDGTTVRGEPCIAMFTSQSNWQPGWLASQADLLAVDWELAWGLDNLS